jgi:hypothetical protein
MPFTIRDLPAVMRRNGWAVGATLMDRWFGRGARAMTGAEKTGETGSPDIETTAVTMAWALTFDRAVQANNHLIASWNTGERRGPSHGVIASRLRAWRASNPTRPGRPFRFGDLRRPATHVDATCQVNRDRIESSMFSSIDDFYAAMGNALVKLAVSGVVTPLPGDRWRLTIDEIGTYIRDTYDFNGDQRLGAWGPSGFSRAAVLAPDIPIIAERTQNDDGQRYFSVNNSSFRAYRNHYRRGGDFVIFSDIVRRRLPQPIVVEVAA